MRFADRLRPPGPGDPAATAAKDWLHVNLFDPVSDVAVVLNTAVHGREGDPAAVANATALLRNRGEWTAHHRVVELAEAATTDRSIAIADELAIGLDPVSGGVTATFRHPSADASVLAALVPRTPPVETTAPVPFGSGWIAWRAVPVLSAQGRLRVGGRTLPLRGMLAYHDHNWGRWRWGEDIGWEWSVCPSRDGALVMTRATDRAHRAGGANVTISLPGPRRWRNHNYGPSSVRVELSRWQRGCRQRIPGAMAVLHAGRAGPLLPRTIEIVVDDGFDLARAELEVDDAIQVIVAEPTGPGYAFIHELFGRFELRGSCRGRRFSLAGHGVFEYVD